MSDFYETPPIPTLTGLMSKIIIWFFRLFRNCGNCKYSYCDLDVIPDWRCKKDRREDVSDKMILPEGYCNDWSKQEDVNKLIP